MNIPTTETIAASEARQHFSSLLNRVFKERDRVVIEKSGIPVAVLVSTEDYKRLERLDREREERHAFLAEIRAPFRGIPESEIEREVEKALQEVRAEMRAEETVSSGSR